VKSAPVWGLEGLEDVEHKLIVSMCPGGQFVVVDAFIFTLFNASSSATSSSSISATHSGVVGAASSTPSSSNSSPNHTAVIAVSSIIAALALLAALLACLFCFRRRRHKRPQHPDFKFPSGGRDTYDDGYTPVPSRFSTTSRFTSSSGMLYPHIAINDPFDPTSAEGLYDRWFSSPSDFGNIFSYFQGSLSSTFKDQPRTRLSTVKS
jgi:hypothetical protein